MATSVSGVGSREDTLLLLLPDMSSEDYRLGEVARLGPTLSPEKSSVPAIQLMLTTAATPGTRQEATRGTTQNCPTSGSGQDAQWKLAWDGGKRVDSSGEGESVDLPALCELAKTCALIDQSDDLTTSPNPKNWPDVEHLPCLSANNNSNTSPKDGSLSMSRQSLGERGISANQQEPTGSLDIDSRLPVVEDQEVLNVDVQVPTDQSDVSMHPSFGEQPNLSHLPSPGRLNTRYGPTSRRAISPGQGLISQRPDSFQRRTPGMKQEPSNQQPSPGPNQPSSPNKVDVGSPRATSEKSKWQLPTTTTKASNWKSSLKEPDTQNRRWPPERPDERSRAGTSEKLDKNKLSLGSSPQQSWNESADKISRLDRKESNFSRATDKQNQLLPRSKVDQISVQQANMGTDSPKKVNTSTSNQPEKQSTEKSGLANYQQSKESHKFPKSQQSKERPKLLDRHLITEKEDVALKKEGSDESHLQISSGSLDTPNLSNPQSSLSKSPRLESPDGQSFKDKLLTSSPSRVPEERILPRTKHTSIVEDKTKIPSLEGNPKLPTWKLSKTIENNSPPETRIADLETPDGDPTGKESLSMAGQSLSKRAGMSSWNSSSEQHPSNVQPNSTTENSDTSIPKDQTESIRQPLASESEIPLGQSNRDSQRKLEETKPVLHPVAPFENVPATTKKMPVDEKSKNSDSANQNNFGRMISKSFLKHPVSDKTPVSSSKKDFDLAMIIPGNVSTSVDTAQWEPYRKTSTLINVNSRYEVAQSSPVDSDEFRSRAVTQEAQEENIKRKEMYVVVTDSVTDADVRKKQSEIPTLPDGWENPSDVRSLPDSLNERRVLEGQLERTNISEHDGLSQSFDHVGDWVDTSLDVSASETPMTLQKKESANELTECDISHSETLADVEKSEPAVPQYEKMPILLVETSQAPSVRLRNKTPIVSDLSLASLDFSQFPSNEPTCEISRSDHLTEGMADGLRQRQPHLASLPPDTDYEVAEPSEQATGFQVGEVTDADVNVLAIQDLPGARNEALRLGILFDIPPAGLGVPGNRGANRTLALYSPYNISFNLMLSMLVITVVLLLNHLRELLWFH